MIRKPHSIQTRLTITYIIYILLFVIMITVFSNYLIQKQFKAYSVDKQSKQIAAFVKQVTNAYQNGWQTTSVESIGTYALEEGYIIRLLDENDKVIWDATLHNGHQCEMVKENIRHRMYQLNPKWQGNYVSSTYIIKNDNTTLGVMQIDYFASFYTEDDALFITTLNQIYLYGSIIFIVIGFIIASYLAKRLATPIEKVVRATTLISQGIYDKIDVNPSNLIEINTLTNSINYLSLNLASQEQLRKQLTADVTHELRTPLTILQTHIEAMLDGMIETNNEELKNIYEEIIRLTKIVSTLDKLSLYDKQEITLNKELVDLNELINNVVNLFKLEYKRKNVSLITEGKKVEVILDKDKINQVFINLLSNALKYTPVGGKVEINTNEDAFNVIIKISDNGLGIDKADLPYIFERFYRADKSRDRSSGGAGIGLTIVKSIISSHQGMIRAKSEVGVGTEITITLPKTN